MARKNDDLAELMVSEVENIRSMKNNITYLKEKGDFTSEAIKLRHNAITLDD